jgi:preprotein translocase subunit SecG
MTNLQLILLIIQIIVVSFMIILVLIQKSGNNSLSGIGASGGVNSAISSKAGNAALTKSIMVLVAIFMGNSLVLATITARSTDSSISKIEKVIEEQKKANTLRTPNISDE